MNLLRYKNLNVKKTRIGMESLFNSILIIFIQFNFNNFY